MVRYTKEGLKTDIVAVNRTLEKTKHKYRLVYEGRNNYCAVDLATPEQLAKGGITGNLATGTARECSIACLAYRRALQDIND